MSIRQDMLVAARRAPSRLGERRGPTVGFVVGQVASDGGFKDRRGASDLYYTVFGAECLQVLEGRLPDTALGAYVVGFGDGGGLDLVHLACLIRLQTLLGGPVGPARTAMRERVEDFRANDGGYALWPRAEASNVYSGFMALSTLQDLGAWPADAGGLLAGVDACRTADGGYANQPGLPLALTPTTAAAVIIRIALGQTVDAITVDWLADRQDDGGGFFATDGAPEPDLLSTAVGLHALVAAGADLSGVAERAEAFVDSLYCDGGGFRGHATGDQADCEYTFYGLLALGRLTGA